MWYAVFWKSIWKQRFYTSLKHVFHYFFSEYIYIYKKKWPLCFTFYLTWACTFDNKKYSYVRTTGNAPKVNKNVNSGWICNRILGTPYTPSHMKVKPVSCLQLEATWMWSGEDFREDDGSESGESSVSIADSDLGGATHAISKTGK